MNPEENNDTFLLIDSQNNYGAVSPYSNGSSNSKTIVYCVHGKPSSGCCKVTQSEVCETKDFSIPNSAQIIENTYATNLVNKHCHLKNEPQPNKHARKKLIVASILCVLFMIGEIIGGYLSNSLAIASDAAHLLTDLASFMISLFSIWMSNRPSTRIMSFGWYRAEVIGALTSVLMIWVVTGILVYMATERVISQTFEIDSKIMLISSGIGVIVNIVMGLTLHQHGHTHGPSSSHSHSHSENINVRAAYIHVLGDFLQSIGVFVAALVIYFKEEWRIVDPICTFLFSVLVLITTYQIIKDVLLVLMEGMPKGMDFKEVMDTILAIDGVKKVHNLRIWALSLDKVAMSAHIAIHNGTNPQSILMVATTNIHNRYNFFEMTLQIEEFQIAMDECHKCKNPV